MDTIRILGLKLADLARDILVLAVNLAKVDQKDRRAAVALTSLPLGLTEVDITWTPPYEDNLYAVLPTLVVGGVVLTAGIGVSLKPGTREPDGCTIIVANLGLAIIASATLDVVTIRT